MKKRRKSRELALQSLFAFELGADEDCLRVLDSMAERNSSSEDVVRYARRLVKKTIEDLGYTDDILQKHTVNWDIKRMAVLDRNILRLAVTEFRFPGETPFRVVIDEAVELAKRYGNSDSGKFVNGVLDATYKEISED